MKAFKLKDILWHQENGTYAADLAWQVKFENKWGGFSAEEYETAVRLILGCGEICVLGYEDDNSVAHIFCSPRKLCSVPIVYNAKVAHHSNCGMCTWNKEENLCLIQSGHGIGALYDIEESWALEPSCGSKVNLVRPYDEDVPSHFSYKRGGVVIAKSMTNLHRGNFADAIPKFAYQTEKCLVEQNGNTIILYGAETDGKYAVLNQDYYNRCSFSVRSTNKERMYELFNMPDEDAIADLRRVDEDSFTFA